MNKMITMFVFLAPSACCGIQRAPAENPSTPVAPAMQTCPEKRPQMCTRIYKPVCATKDTGVRCVRAPCPSTENLTYGNECTACADEKVLGYAQGECPADTKQD